MSKEWHEIFEELAPLQKQLASLSLDDFVEVYYLPDVKIAGFVAETEDPRLLRLLECEQLMVSDFTEYSHYIEAKNSVGPNQPLHRVVAEIAIDTSRVLCFRRPIPVTTMCVWTQNLK